VQRRHPRTGCDTGHQGRRSALSLPSAIDAGVKCQSGANGLGEPLAVLRPPADSDNNLKSIRINSFVLRTLRSPVCTKGNLPLEPFINAEIHVAHTSRQGAVHGSVRSADRTVAHPHRLGVQSILGQGGTPWRAMRW
jgi:hypothetical protein